MNQNLKNEILGLIWNLSNGLKLAVFQKVDVKVFRTGLDQMVMLVLFYCAITFLHSLILSQPEPEFNIAGIANIATHVGLILLSIYIISKLTNIKLETLFVVTFSIWPWFYIAWAIIGKGENFTIWQFYGGKKELYMVYNIYFIAAVSTALVRIGEENIKTYVVVFTSLLVVVFIPAQHIYTGQFWHLSYNYDKDQEKYKKINQEDTYYKQFGFINKLQQTLLPSRKNITDLYFVGFGSYAPEDVFMKEVNYAKDLFDSKFDTKGRSVALINNYKTVNAIPLASRTNLGLVLKHLGKIIDKDDDVVFIYLTSHGSKKHRLSVDFNPLRLNTIGPKDLKFYLDESGIKWRILIVSACYSGGFVEPLKDQYTVIMTASASDRQSFGCGSKSEFTYFGNAIFREQLSKKFNFLSAFENALISIQQREKKEKIKPSMPQLFIGDKIRLKLDGLGAELEKYYLKNSSNGVELSKKL